MLVGIASGTYSSIFIASPVLTAWKEREPGFVRRRLRIAEVEGGVPGLRRRGRAGEARPTTTETEAEIARAERPRRRGAEPQAGRGRDGRADRASGDGAATPADGEPTAAPTPASAERRAAQRRAPRAPPGSAASTGGSARSMALLVWFTMGIALWHFTVFLPDRFWQGIVGAFLGAVIGAVVFGADRRGDQRPRPRRHRSRHGADRGPGRRDRPRRRLGDRRPRSEQRARLSRWLSFRCSFGARRGRDCRRERFLAWVCAGDPQRISPPSPTPTPRRGRSPTSSG